MRTDRIEQRLQFLWQELFPMGIVLLLAAFGWFIARTGSGPYVLLHPVNIGVLFVFWLALRQLLGSDTAQRVRWTAILVAIFPLFLFPFASLLEGLEIGHWSWALPQYWGARRWDEPSLLFLEVFGAHLLVFFLLSLSRPYRSLPFPALVALAAFVDLFVFWAGELVLYFMLGA